MHRDLQPRLLIQHRKIEWPVETNAVLGPRSTWRRSARPDRLSRRFCPLVVRRLQLDGSGLGGCAMVCASAAVMLKAALAIPHVLASDPGSPATAGGSGVGGRA